MSEMLTAKEMQDRLQVDRSTIYRMAEAGRLPAIKVGKQWRFPADKVDTWFEKQMSMNQPSQIMPASIDLNGRVENLSDILPVECVQLIQDTFAELLGVMLVVTDIDGKPITEISNPCNLFSVVSQVPDALEKCIHSWSSLATTIDLEPKFSESHLGLLCSRAMVRVGTELQGMVVAGCVAPENWPPDNEEVDQIALDMGVDQSLISPHLDNVFKLSPDQRVQVLKQLQRIANIVAHIVEERRSLVSRLEAISNLTAF
jgi:excisionase family DNA binding protein